jgi:hypothetical protein
LIANKFEEEISSFMKRILEKELGGKKKMNANLKKEL